MRSNSRRTPRLVVLVLQLGAMIAGQAVASARGQVRVVTLGDSWADRITAPLQQVFLDAGRTDVVVEYAEGGGGTAAWWASPTGEAEVVAQLSSLAPLDHVVVSLGGNDLLTLWNAQLPLADANAVFDSIATDIATVLGYVRAAAPDARIVLSSYDYPNFVETVQADALGVCALAWKLALLEPSISSMNSAVLALDSRKAMVANGEGNTVHSDAFGLMQVAYGYPALGLAPHDRGLPNTDLPSPPEALADGGNDCIHVSSAGYEILARDLWQNTFAPLAASPWLSSPAPGASGTSNYLAVAQFPPGATLLLAASPSVGAGFFSRCPELELGLANPIVVGSVIADDVGAAALSVFLPASLAHTEIAWQAVAPDSCVASPVVVAPVDAGGE